MNEVCQRLSIQDSVLLSASRANLPKTIKAVIEEGVDPNIKRLTDGYTPLLLAAWDGLLDNVRVLVEAGADINAVSNEGGSALMLAAQRGWREIVEYLLSRGADKTLVDLEGYTALGAAQTMGHLEIVKLISR
ncbi:MAG: ankyrin repeat domain-containing protein [Candidatus Yanofskybacteria bacterium]|nr:ankyrin repeat domain-containing protein [Candidatus Yanofskybacteria bacterium]